MRKIIAVLALLMMPNFLHAAACNPPYDAFSMNCTPEVFNTAHYPDLTSTFIDLGGGTGVVRLEQGPVNTYYPECLPGGIGNAVDTECYESLAQQYGLNNGYTPPNGSVTVPKISASGTPSATTFFRGDGSWTALATVASTGAYSDLTGKPSLATVATTGSYADLSSKPSIPVTYLGTSQVTNPVRVIKTGTTPVTSVNITADNTSGGTALCQNAVDAVDFRVNGTSDVYNASWSAGTGNKVLTISAIQANLLGLGVSTIASSLSYSIVVDCH